MKNTDFQHVQGRIKKVANVMKRARWAEKAEGWLSLGLTSGRILRMGEWATLYNQMIWHWARGSEKMPQ